MRKLHGLIEMDAFNGIVGAAQPRDAGSLSGIYRTTYGSKAFERIGGNYPFPQFMNTEWVDGAIERERIFWLVSRANGAIAGAVGAVSNIGSARDRIAECFGLVVGRQWQGKGVGKKLMASLVDTFRDRAAVMIGETRTGDPAAFRVIKSAGWLPFGFEPFAHRMPTGAEPMIMMGCLSEDAMRDRSLPGYVSPAVARLAEAVLSQFGAPAPQGSAVPDYPVEHASWPQLRALVVAPETPEQRSLYQTLGDGESFHLRIGNDPALRFGNQIGEKAFHTCGIVELDHMRAEDPTGGRVIEIHLTGCIGETPVASAHLVWDLLDRRVRINGLTTGIEGLQGIMLSHLLSWLDKERRARKTLLCVVVDVRADRPNLQGTLERLGCFPTAYYPSLVADDSARHDAVQYTKLYDQRFSDCLEWIRGLDLGEGARVVDAIARGVAPTLP